MAPGVVDSWNCAVVVPAAGFGVTGFGVTVDPLLEVKAKFDSVEPDGHPLYCGIVRVTDVPTVAEFELDVSALGWVGEGGIGW